MEGSGKAGEAKQPLGRRRSSQSLTALQHLEVFWEPEDPACTTTGKLPASTSRAFLDLHEIYWQPPSEEEKVHLDGQPKGFLPFLEPQVDGTPKGFLYALDDISGSDLLADGKPKGFLHLVGEEPKAAQKQRRTKHRTAWRRILSSTLRHRLSDGNPLEQSAEDKPAPRQRRRKKRGSQQPVFEWSASTWWAPQIQPKAPAPKRSEKKRDKLRSSGDALSFQRERKARETSLDEDPLAAIMDLAIHVPHRQRTERVSLESVLDARPADVPIYVDEEDVRRKTPRKEDPTFDSGFQFPGYSQKPIPAKPADPTSPPLTSKVGYETLVNVGRLNPSAPNVADVVPPISPSVVKRSATCPERGGASSSRLTARVTPGRDWNERFQSLLEHMYASQGSSTAEFRQLCDDFATVAKRLGTIIISELFLPDEERTIPPVTTAMGGVAGGEKYVYLPEGMFFKFAVDEHGLYNGDEGIMKAAGHELRALLELMDCRVSRLHFPLMVTVDFRGYRLIAMPLLPVGHDTLVYGSADGGQVIKSSDSRVNARMELVGRKLNLAAHTVTNLSGDDSKTVFGPVDMEVHKGRDGRFYVLDIARLFPPSTPVAGLKGCQLYRMLRPELVRANPVPLCSDGFSTFDVDNLASFEDDINEATQRMHNELVPEFAAWLDARFVDVDLDVMAPDVMEGEFQQVTAAMHRRGINLRCLGLVRLCSTSESVKRFLFTQAVARTAKQILWSRMRNLKTSSEAAYWELIITYMNVLFGTGRQSTAYWCSGVKNSILKRFMRSLTNEERHVSCDLRTLLYMLPLYKYIQSLSGFTLSDDVDDIILDLADRRELSASGDEQTTFPITMSMTVGLVPRVKTIHHMDFAEGTILSKRAALAKEGADALFELADERFRATLLRKPDDAKALHNWGLSLLHRAKRTGEGPQADQLYSLAARKFESCLVIDPRDYFALFLWGNMLSAQALRTTDKEDALERLAAACEKFALSDRIKPGTFDVLFNWANSLLYIVGIGAGSSKDRAQLLRRACQLYEQAVPVASTTTRKAYRNWGVALSKLARLDKARATELFEEADHRLAQSLEQVEATESVSNSEVYFNWGNLHYHKAKHAVSRHQVEDAVQDLLEAGEKYMAALENGGAFINSLLINWGKALTLLTHIEPSLIPKGVRLLDVVDMYLGVLFAMLYSDTARPSLKPVIALACCGHKDIVARVIFSLRRIESTMTGKPLLEAKQGLEMAAQVQEQSGVDIEELCKDPAAQPPVAAAVTVFLRQMKLGQQVLDSPNRTHTSAMPALRDFEKLSAMVVSGNSWECTVTHKGTSRLYIMKTVKRSSAQGKGGSLGISPCGEKSWAEEGDTDGYLSLVTAGQLPFLVSDVYIYKRRKAFYFIQELLPDELLLDRIRQSPMALVKYLKGPSPRSSQLLEARRSSDPYQRRAPSVTHQRSSPLAPRSELLRRSTSEILSKVVRVNSGSSGFSRCRMREEACRFYAAEIVVAFSALHRFGFVYGNLRPSNLHADAEGHLCLNAFSYHCHADGDHRGFCQSTDWWSLGNVLYDMLFGVAPSDPLEVPPTVSAPLSSLLHGLLEVDAKKRLGSKGSAEVRAHPFFEAIEWKMVAKRGLKPPFVPREDLQCRALSPTAGVPGDPPMTSGFGFESIPTIMASNQDASFHWFSAQSADGTPRSPGRSPGRKAEEAAGTLESIGQLANHLRGH